MNIQNQIRFGQNPVVDNLLWIELLSRRILDTRYGDLNVLNQDVQNLNQFVQGFCTDPRVVDEVNRIPSMGTAIDACTKLSSAAINYATTEMQRINQEIAAKANVPQEPLPRYLN
jgi:hypothetical protein